ncbi:MAG: hypothetical protein GY835_13510 [bacterium]|nr:hypothetical protein [bacterium]
MKAGLLITGNGALIYLTTHNNFMDDELKEKIRAKGIEKFIAYEVPLNLAEERYGRHFEIVATDLGGSNDLRILDYEGSRAFRMFSFSELGETVVEEGEALKPYGVAKAGGTS